MTKKINKTVDKTIDSVYWLDYIEMTELEYNDWRDWCREFLLTNCTPQYSAEWIRTQFADWSLLYPFKIKE